MKFKNYEDYRAQREALYNAAEELLQNGDVEGANARMEEVEKLDNAYEAFATAQANLAAMQGQRDSASGRRGRFRRQRSGKGCIRYR